MKSLVLVVALAFAAALAPTAVASDVPPVPLGGSICVQAFGFAACVPIPDPLPCPPQLCE